MFNELNILIFSKNGISRRIYQSKYPANGGLTVLLADALDDEVRQAPYGRHYPHFLPLPAD